MVLKKWARPDWLIFHGDAHCQRPGPEGQGFHVRLKNPTIAIAVINGLQVIYI
jgi:hypothetical protein